MFHHIAVLKMTVHEAYVDFITTGVMPDPMPVESDWSTPRVERTDFFDIFDQQHRMWAFSVIWGVMEHVTRKVDTETKGGEEAGDGNTA